MYKLITVEINSRNSFYDYLKEIGICSQKLYNTALFHSRQLISSTKKNENELSDNENLVLERFQKMNNAMTIKNKTIKKMYKNGYISYDTLYNLLFENEISEMLDKKMPKHTIQYILKKICQNISSYFASLKDFYKNPKKYKGKPQLPYYKKEDEICNFGFSNQECVVKEKNNKYFVKFPKTKMVLEIPGPSGRLKTVDVSFKNKVFKISFIFETEETEKELPEISKRICGIDLGVDNLMAVVNNVGLPNMLYKGGYIKSKNHLYNKKIAKIISVNTKGKVQKYIASNRYSAITNKRNNQLKDYFSKIACHLIKWCINNNIDTIVVGSNKEQKQKSNMGHKNNQEFNQIPFYLLKRQIEYRAKNNGIIYIETEESYTSKASYLDNDYIPTLEEKSDNISFSGKRIKRGLYKSKNDIIINADLNASANIIRKVFDYVKIAFNDVIIIKNIMSYM